MPFYMLFLVQNLTLKLINGLLSLLKFSEKVSFVRLFKLKPVYQYIR